MMAKEMKKVLRCKNYILDIFWKLNGGKVIDWDGSKVPLTYEFVHEHYELGPLIKNFKDCFKNYNLPKHDIQKSMTENIQRLWDFSMASKEKNQKGKEFFTPSKCNFVVDVGKPVANSVPWLKKGKSSSDYQIFTGPSSAVLALGSWWLCVPYSFP